MSHANNRFGMSILMLAAAAFLLGSLLMVLVDPNFAYAQIPNNNTRDDLTQAVAPTFDFNNTEKSMVVLLKFTALNKAEFVASGISYGPPHSNIGNPPLLKVQLYDYGGSIIQQFNYWHPLFAFEFQEDGKDHLRILPSAVGRFVFPFDPKIALMKVSYRGEEVISVDLRPPMPKFCDQFPDDPDCRSSDLAVLDVSTINGQQQLPLLIGNSANVTVRTTVTNMGPDTPTDAILSSNVITSSGSGSVLVTRIAGSNPNENGSTTTIVASLNERQQYDQTYTIECWEPGKYNIIFEGKIASQSGAVADPNELNNKGQMNFEVDCGLNGPKPDPKPLSVSIQPNVTEDGSPPTTIEFRAITDGGTEPYKFRWNFDDNGNDSSSNNIDVKGGQLMTHQFTRLGQYNVTVAVTDSADGYRGQTAFGNIIITINDKEPPQINVPSNIIVEARGPNGANVTFTVFATDNVDGSVPVNCLPYSGSQFRLGDTIVTCKATDKSGNTAQKSFTVTVQDTTPPTLTVPPFITVEASEPSTSVPYPPATATDTVDPLPTVECYPASPIIIAGVGSQTIACKATDKSGNTAQKSFTVTVQDTTPPTLTLPPNPLIVTPSNPAPASPSISDITFMQRAPRIPVNFTVSATDKVDGTSTLEEDGSTITQDNVGGNIMISCNPPSGSMFLVGNTTTVRCSARDATNNTGTASFTVSVNAPPPPPADTTAPVVEANVQGTLGNNGWYTSDVAVSWTVTDPESQITSKSESCDQTTTINQDTTAGGQTVTCTAASAGGTTTQSVTIKRDATAPDIAIDSGISDGDTFEKGQVPSEPTCGATDGGSGVDGQGCQVLGYSTEVGKHTITFTATDNAGNKATQEVSYSVNDKLPQQELQPRQKLQPQQELQPRRGLQPQNESQVG